MKTFKEDFKRLLSNESLNSDKDNNIEKVFFHNTPKNNKNQLMVNRIRNSSNFVSTNNNLPSVSKSVVGNE
jgi:hypothetical protein